MGSFLLAIDWSLVRVGLVILGMGIFTVVMETVVMVLFKFDRFGRSLVYSIMANIGSLLLGILLFLIFNKTEFGVSQRSELIILFCITSLFEAWLIKLLNPGYGWRTNYSDQFCHESFKFYIPLSGIYQIPCKLFFPLILTDKNQKKSK